MTQPVQATGFTIEQLEIVPLTGIAIDVRPIFEELNLFNSIFIQVQSGNIVLRDSIELINLLSLDGNEEIRIRIKSDALGGVFSGTFRIYKLDNRLGVRHTTQVYTLHFVSKPFLVSEKTKSKKFLRMRYSDMWQIFMGEVGAEVGFCIDSVGVYELAVPLITPFQAADWVSRRAINPVTTKPDYVTYESPITGFTFAHLSYLTSQPPKYVYNFFAKDVNTSTLETDYYSIRDWKVLSNFDIEDATQSGVFGGAFWGFDTMTRTWKKTKYGFEDLYPPCNAHCDAYPNIPENALTPEGRIAPPDYADSRWTIHPYQLPRKPNEWINSHNKRLADYAENQHLYVLQRRHSFGMLKQKRVQTTLPGNFNVASGDVLNFKVPAFVGEKALDPHISGDYLVTATRHIIKYDRFETLLEVASDSTPTPRGGSVCG